MTVGRGALVYGVAAIVGFIFAFSLLPRGDGGGGPGVAVEALEGESSQKRTPRMKGKKARRMRGGKGASERIGTGGNPGARQISGLLSTSAHELIAKTSPVWVQASASSLSASAQQDKA